MKLPLLFLIVIPMLAACSNETRTVSLSPDKIMTSPDSIVNPTTQPVLVSAHEVVSIVREFIKAIDGGDYDRAIGLGAPGEFKKEGLIKINELFEFDQAIVDHVHIGGENAAVLTNPIPAQAPVRTGQFGYSLRKNCDRWLIRDVDYLPHEQAVDEWLSGFRSVESAAKRVAVAE